MKLIPPFPLSSIDNPFGANPGISYQAIDGTIGHPGIDFNIPYGTPIPAATNAPCSAILSKDNSDLMAFRAVNTIYEEAGGCYEIQYGHCSNIYASVGQELVQGEAIAAIGNTGEVFVGTTEVTEAQKDAGSHAGAHLHFQVRVIAKEPATGQIEPNRHYLNDGTGLLVLNGYRYWVPNWYNGYDGCVDPMDFFEGGLEDVIKDEVAVDATISDPSVRKSFEEQIIKGAEKLIGLN